MKISLPRIRNDARTRWTVIVVLILFIAVALFLSGRYRTLQVQDLRGGNLFVFFLINFNILLLTVLIFLLARNAIKLFYEGRRKVFGYHLRTRLVAIFVGFSLIPTLALFFVARGFISDSIEYWFDLNVDQAVEGAVSVSQEYYGTVSGRVIAIAQRAAEQLARDPGEEGYESLVEKVRKDYILTGLEVFNGEGERLARSWDEVSPQDFTDPQSSLVQNALVGRVVDGIMGAEKGEFIQAAAPLALPDGQGAAVVSLHVSQVLRETTENINRTYRGYTEMKLQKMPIRSNYMVYLLLLTMLILFSASWLGFYLARGITVPIGLLAEGAERVADGDLGVRVDTSGTDEIGILVDSFNRMTAQLEMGRLSLETAHRDLAESYQVNEERRAYIETVLRSVGTGVVSIDKGGRVNTFNRAAEVMFAAKADEVMGHHFDELLSPEHTRIFKKMLAEVSEGEKRNLRREMPVVVQGHPMILMVNVSILEDVRGEQLGFVLVLEDLTKLVNAQKKAAWSEVAKRIAHEIKNPLTPIKLSAERIRRRLLGKLDADQEKVLQDSTDSIIREVNGMRGLVDEFSQFARLPVLNSVPGQINDAVREAVALYAGRGTKGVEIDMELSDKLHTLSYDRDQIRRVIINLLENAIRAVDEKGEGRVMVATGMAVDEGMVTISVVDEGTGVPEELRDRIFEPYFSTSEEGTGLGLAIAQRVVEEHGGVIGYAPNTPSGSVFTVKIPVDIDPGRRA